MPVGPNLGLSRDGIRFLDPVAGGAQPGVVDRRVPGGDRRRHRGVPTRRCRASSSTSDGYRAGGFLPGRRATGGAAAVPQAAAGPLRAVVGDARLRAARPPVPRVPGDLLAGRARLLPQVHGRRAHAADDPQPRAARRARPSRPAQRFKTSLRGIPSPELLVLALLLHDVGKWRDDEHALESVRMAADALDRLQLRGRRARDGPVPHPASPADVARRRSGATPRTRRSSRSSPQLVGTEERLKMLCLMTLADIEAVSPETLTPWKEELIWRLYVDTYNHLTQRYGDELIERNQAGLIELLAGRPGDLPEAEITRLRRRAAAALPAAVLRATPSTVTCGWRATSSPDEVHVSLERREAGVDARRRHARQAVPVLEHLRRAVVVRHEHPARPRADQPERAGPRRLPVHRRRALPRAERRTRGAQVLARPAGGRLRTRRRHRAAARPRAERAAAARIGAASRRSSAPTTRRRDATPFSTSSRATRSGCSTASAA